jgi:hypothetical protein
LQGPTGCLFALEPAPTRGVPTRTQSLPQPWNSRAHTDKDTDTDTDTDTYTDTPHRHRHRHIHRSRFAPCHGANGIAQGCVTVCGGRGLDNPLRCGPLATTAPS